MSSAHLLQFSRVFSPVFFASFFRSSLFSFSFERKRVSNTAALKLAMDEALEGVTTGAMIFYRGFVELF